MQGKVKDFRPCDMDLMLQNTSDGKLTQVSQPVKESHAKDKVNNGRPKFSETSNDGRNVSTLNS